MCLTWDTGRKIWLENTVRCMSEEEKTQTLALVIIIISFQVSEKGPENILICSE